jgi:hypothetical protein
MFFITDEDEILKVPIARFERMLKGSDKEKTERYAGKCVRAAEIAVMIENREPVEVLRAIYFYLHFDEKGILDYDRFMEDGHLVATAGISPIFMEKPKGNIIDAKKEFAKRKRDHAVWWKPDMQLERDILDASLCDLKCKGL